MEEKKNPDEECVDLYTADMTEASTSESTKVPVVSTSSPHNTNAGGATTTCTGGLVCIVCEKTAVKSCLTCTAFYCNTHIEQHYTVPALRGHKVVETGEVGQNLCKQHYKGLELFCKTDQIPICAVCLAKEHIGHDIIPNKTNQTSSQNPEKMDPECSTIKGIEQLASTRSCNRSPFEIEPFPIRKLIEQSQAIQTDIPACYLLPTAKTLVDGNPEVRRWTFGKRDDSKSTKTVLIVGETGTGKTTLINTMVNFMLGVKWEDRVWFQIMDEGKKKSQAESQTSAITVYELFLETSSSCLRIIDTPGYGATDGIKVDQQIADNLLVLFRSKDGIHEIEAVGLVLKASQNRLTDFQRYIFDAVLSLFGKDIERNIVVFITHSDGLPAANIINALNEAEVPCAKDSSGKPLHFMFNNRQHETYEEDQEDIYQGLWKLGYRSVEKFFSNLEGFDRTELKMTEGVLRERKRLEACVHNLQDAIKMEELKQNELKQTQKALEKNKNKRNNENFTFEVDEPYKAKVTFQSSWWHLSKQATCCTICEENCHYPGCWLVKDLSWCSVMKDNKCTVCRGKCPVSAHVKQNMIYVPSTRKVEKTAEDLKQRYEKQVDIKKALEKDLDSTKAKISKLLEEVYQCILKLEKIALKKNAFSTLVHLDFLIERMKKTGDDEKVQMLLNLCKQNEALHKKAWRNFKAGVSGACSSLGAILHSPDTEESRPPAHNEKSKQQ